jgi:tRNA(fMet)-specific endonuclease VapC
VILLDTDHLTVLKYSESDRYARLSGRLLAVSPQVIGTTIVNVEEQMRGWLAAIAKEKTLSRQMTAYRELTDLFDFFAKLNIVSLNAEAVALFGGFRKAGVKIGTMDLKMACIAIANSALFLMANRRDFGKVPGLRFENWLE